MRDELLGELGRSSGRQARNPLAYARLTNAQRAYASSTHRYLLWRGGNSIGKSYGNAWDTLHELRGTHPLRPVPRPPVFILCVGYSFAQMDPLCRKIWDLIPRHEIDPRVRYVPGNGFRGFKEPVIPFVAGPGAGSLLSFATYEQGAGRIMGWQGHALKLDEPPPEQIYAECLPRLNSYHGSLRITMTPTPESPPLLYLKQEVERGKIKELQTSLNVNAVTPRGGLIDVPWMSEAEIEEALDSYLPDERPMREHGDWEGLTTGRVLEAILDQHFTDEELPPRAVWYLAIGIDHGVKAGRQAVVLVACSEDGSEVWVLDEIQTEEITSVRQDAANILELLARNNLTWDAIDQWRGDRRHGGDYWSSEKSNIDLTRELARAIGLTQKEVMNRGLRIKVPHKRSGSARRGFRIMNSLAREGQLRVRRRCRSFEHSCKNWAGRPEDPLKDVLDAGRYAIEALLDAEVLRLKIPSVARYL